MTDGLVDGVGFKGLFGEEPESSSPPAEPADPAVEDLRRAMGSAVISDGALGAEDTDLSTPSTSEGRRQRARSSASRNASKLGFAIKMLRREFGPEGVKQPYEVPPAQDFRTGIGSLSYNSSFAPMWAKLLLTSSLKEQREALLRLERIINQYWLASHSVGGASIEDLSYLGAAILIMRKHSALASTADSVIQQLWPEEPPEALDQRVVGYEYLTYRKLREWAFDIAVNCVERGCAEFPDPIHMPNGRTEIRAMLASARIDESSPTLHTDAWMCALATVLSPRIYTDYRDLIAGWDSDYAALMASS